MKNYNKTNETAISGNPGRPKKPVIFAMFIIAATIIGYNFTVETIYCTEKVLATKPKVVMLGSPWCPYCSKARHYFTHNKISYCEYDVGDSAQGKALYNRAIDQGLPQVIPILLIGDFQISGFNKARIDQLIEN